jgi:hypothetical protein
MWFARRLKVCLVCAVYVVCIPSGKRFCQVQFVPANHMMFKALVSITLISGNLYSRLTMTNGLSAH